jgi:ubiquinone/menaquinone biosynthesis C-methylase UbiE
VRLGFHEHERAPTPICCRGAVYPPLPSKTGSVSGCQPEAVINDHEPWQLTGNAAELYERYLVPAITRVWAADLVRRAALQPDERVLDVACGTGIVARLAAEQVGAQGVVVGLDLNTAMLAVARALPRLPGAPISWTEASVLDMPFPDATFNAVLCQLGLQFFPDRPRALREMRRVLVPGGRVLLSVFGPLAHNPAPQALADALERHLGPHASAIKRAEHDLDDPAELDVLVADAGFAEVTIQTTTQQIRFPSPREYVRIQFAATPLATLILEMSRDEQVALTEAVIAAVSEALQLYIGDDGLVFPQECHILSASPGGR